MGDIVENYHFRQNEIICLDGTLILKQLMYI